MCQASFITPKKECAYCPHLSWYADAGKYPWDCHVPGRRTKTLKVERPKNTYTEQPFPAMEGLKSCSILENADV